MSNLTTLGIGGNAKFFITVKSIDELNEAIAYAKNSGLEFLIIGSGSNLLVSDEVVNKLIIKNEITGISHQGNTIISQSGTILQDLVDYSIEHGLSGLQKLSGIPGTVGGAIYGNAGAYGQSISDHLTEVLALDTSVILSERSESKDLSRMRVALKKSNCGFDYRFSNFKKNGLIVAEVTFNLENSDPKTLKKESEEIKLQRNKKYPPGIKCPGSFFKNIIAENLPKEILQKIPYEKIIYGKLPVGALLEEVGAKGDKLGDIEIANYHANLFINKGNGNAKDFYDLAKKYIALVKEKFGIQLEPEVQLVNLPAF